MSENGPVRPLSGELRPARPRRPAGTEAGVSGSPWDVVARVEELHEVAWSIVDAVAVVRDGLLTLSREVGALQGTLGTETHEHVFFRETMNRRLNAIHETLDGDAAAHQAALTAIAETPALVTGTHEIKALVTNLVAKTADLSDRLSTRFDDVLHSIAEQAAVQSAALGDAEGRMSAALSDAGSGLVATTADLSDQLSTRFDDILLTLREQATAQTAALGEAASRMSAMETELSAMRRAADRERRSTTREIQSLRAEVQTVVEPPPQELPQPKKKVTPRRSAAARKESPSARATAATTEPGKRERRARKPT